MHYHQEFMFHRTNIFNSNMTQILMQSFICKFSNIKKWCPRAYLADHSNFPNSILRCLETDISMHSLFFLFTLSLTNPSCSAWYAFTQRYIWGYIFILLSLAINFEQHYTEMVLYCPVLLTKSKMISGRNNRYST